MMPFLWPVIPSYSIKWLRLEIVAIPKKLALLTSKNSYLSVQENLEESAQKLLHRMVVQQKKVSGISENDV